MIKRRFKNTDYFVDTEGNVYGKNGKILKPSINHRGYQMVNLMIDGKRKGIAVHSIVAQTFIPNINNKLTVNHKDGNKQNNAKNNLEWMTYEEQMKHSVNVLHNYDNISTKTPINAKHIETGNILYFNSLGDAARYISSIENITFESAKLSIWRALKGIRKSYKKMIWEYQ